jgi:two-component system, chemotaxis family, protein-glutamate methylesterase/glutaminase
MADIAAVRPDLIVVGSSAGGIPVLMDLVAGMPVDLPAAVVIVQHIGSHPSILPELLTARGGRKALHARDGEPLSMDVIHVAPPDHHLTIVADTIQLTKGPRENHARPAIDPLFRSAAIAKGARVIGVILSGRLDDGTAGLQAIKACGGLAVVQDPGDAEEPGMPASAIDNVAVDHIATRGTLAGTLLRLVGEPVAVQPAPPDALVREHRLSQGEENGMEQLDRIGTPSRIACPDCNGVLWKIRDSSPPRYRCHTGHAYTLRSLEYQQAQRTDESLWSALRALNEREALLREMMLLSRRTGDEAEAQRLEKEAEHAAMHAQQLQQIATAG